MSRIVDKFYNIFWNDKVCRNLFLLSKIELLETISFGDEEFKYTHSSSRIIISNNTKIDEDTNTVAYRNVNNNIDIEGDLEGNILVLQPKLEKYFKSKFEHSFKLLLKDFEEEPISLLIEIAQILFDKEANHSNYEQILLKYLKKYHFINPQIDSLDEMFSFIIKKINPSKKNDLVNSENINIGLELIYLIKERYVNQKYKLLYTSNQILTSTLNKDEDFKSRIKLFNKLFDTDIISSSREEAFIECIDCSPNTYRGVFQIKISPKKLKNLKCPICSSKLNYFIPYELNEEIYSITNSKDGILLDAIDYRLCSSNLNYELNKHFLNDIEIDCIVENGNNIYIIESKMYKKNTTTRKLYSKIRADSHKLIEDCNRIKEVQFKNKKITPLLITNIDYSKKIKALEKTILKTEDFIDWNNFRITDIEEIFELLC